MRNSNANNTILFIEKKKEFENNRDNHNSKDNKIVIKDKNAKIISLSTYKRLKFKRHHIINKGEKPFEKEEELRSLNQRLSKLNKELSIDKKDNKESLVFDDEVPEEKNRTPISLER